MTKVIKIKVTVKGKTKNLEEALRSLLHRQKKKKD